jgi:hypothetical protein
MTDEEELGLIVERVLELHATSKDVSPAWIATTAMALMKFSRELHRLGYAGCHLELRQIARGKLRKRFDPTAIADDDAEDQPDFFPETLQERYPIARKRGEEATYRKLVQLTKVDVSFNVNRMRRASGALGRHADRLEAWDEARGDIDEAS